MKKAFVTIFAFLALGAGCNRHNPPSVSNAPMPVYDYSHKLQIGNQVLMVEVSATAAQMQQGLSGRAYMAKDQGMLFDFGSRSGVPAFWMKDMKFDLDFVWIADGKIAGITPDVRHPNSPGDPLPTYLPPQPVNRVLEVNAGWAKKNNIAVGDEVLVTN